MSLFPEEQIKKAALCSWILTKFHSLVQRLPSFKQKGPVFHCDAHTTGEPATKDILTSICVYLVLQRLCLSRRLKNRHTRAFTI